MDPITKNKINILIAEDHALTRIGLKVALEQKEDTFVVGETDSGKEAIELTCSLKPALVILDIGLLELSGIESCKEIKTKNPEVKILMLTSHEAEEEILASLSSGADGYCLKGADPEELYMAVKSVYQGNSWLSRRIAEKVFKKLYGQEISDVQAAALDEFPKQSRKENPHYPLSEREFEVLKMIVEGNSNLEISQALYISVPTVKTHVKSILNKLCVDDRVQAVVKAMKQGIISI